MRAGKNSDNTGGWVCQPNPRWVYHLLIAKNIGGYRQRRDL
jgi:hypothetical protein